jgi:hypothetical protein
MADTTPRRLTRRRGLPICASMGTRIPTDISKSCAPRAQARVRVSMPGSDLVRSIDPTTFSRGPKAGAARPKRPPRNSQ